MSNYEQVKAEILAEIGSVVYHMGTEQDKKVLDVALHIFLTTYIPNYIPKIKDAVEDDIRKMLLDETIK